ncbi:MULTISPECIES: hypothetical protein [Acinetobacter]|uniref:hypothetical protein n=1 Tax=Acinetobacter TaxID=469 RepID=UPI0022AC5EAE|nr:hypothetical protein [Acinetobacter sp. TR11]WAU74850.1 hypothetical protein O1450_07145 [Acinetobacter sp. TR11]
MKKIICIFWVIGLISCGKSQKETHLEEQVQRQLLELEKLNSEKLKKEQEAQTMVKELSFDPESVKFQKMNGSCGEMNTKNKLGAYVGYRRFMVSNFGEENERQAFVSGMSVSENLTLDKLVNLTFEQKWLVECENFKVSKNANLTQCAKESQTAFMTSDFYLKHKGDATIEDIRSVLTKNKEEKEKQYVINILDEISNLDKKGHVQMFANPTEFPIKYGIDKYKICISK